MELTAFFAENPRAAIAFSGGVDSAFLLYAAAQSGAQVKAYYVKTAFQPQFELEDAKRLAQELNVPMQVLELDIFCQDSVIKNPKNRCYYCKKAIFQAVISAAAADGFCLVLDGTNASDRASDRPGMQALSELQVRSPLRECGLTKDEIRRLSRKAGLFTWDKPAYACLATRIPAGTPITREALLRTEWAENYLASLGLRDFRVRNLGNDAKIQVSSRDLPLLLTHRAEITAALKEKYHTVLLDLEVRDEQ